jgi:PAS domain-containing protein
MSLIRDSKGNPIGFRGVSRNITERKKTEEALRQSEEKYRTILETMQEAYYELDLAGHFTFVNEAICRHLGYSKEELMGMDPQQLQDETTAKKIDQVYRDLQDRGIG